MGLILLSAVGYSIGLPIVLLLLDLLLPWGAPIVPEGFRAWPIVFVTLGSLGALLAVGRLLVGARGPAVWRRILDETGQFISLATLLWFAELPHAPIRWALYVAMGSLLAGLLLAVFRSPDLRTGRRFRS